MANKTLLNAVNEIFRRVGMIQGDAGLLTSLTDQSRQRSIDIAVQVVNEGIDELYSTSELPMPSGQKESTFTLATSTRSYSLATDLVRLKPYPGGILAIDKTNTQFMYEYPDGYNGLLLLDPEQDDTGLPLYAAINPTDGTLQVDRAPTASDGNGNVYTYQYEKELTLSVLTDTVPFGNAVFRAMVPAWVQLYRRDQQNDFDAGIFRASTGRASRLLSLVQPQTNYSPR